MDQVIYEDHNVPYTKIVPETRRIPIEPDFEYCYRLAMEDFDKGLVSAMMLKGG